MATEAQTWESQMAIVMAAFAEENPLQPTIVHIGDVSLKTLIAATPEQKANGMIGRTFDGYDAMLFVQDATKPATFHNKGVPQATQVTTFDAEGKLVDQVVMKANDPTLVTVSPHVFAIETHGGRGFFPSDARLVLTNG